MNQPAQPAPEGAYLSEISERLRTQDNRITENPMFCVQQKRKICGLDPRCSDEREWLLDGERVEPDTEGAEEFGFCEEWETAMVAFTEEGCKEYLRQNGHNLRAPRIYVESFNRCPEMVAIRKWLMQDAQAALRARCERLEGAIRQTIDRCARVELGAPSHCLANDLANVLRAVLAQPEDGIDKPKQL